MVTGNKDQVPLKTHRGRLILWTGVRWGTSSCNKNHFLCSLWGSREFCSAAGLVTRLRSCDASKPQSELKFLDVFRRALSQKDGCDSADIFGKCYLCRAASNVSHVLSCRPSLSATSNDKNLIPTRQHQPSSSLPLPRAETGSWSN